MVVPRSRTCVNKWSFLATLVVMGVFMIMGKEKGVYALPGESYENSMGEAGDGASGPLGDAMLGYGKLKEATEKEREENIERVVGGEDGAKNGSRNGSEHWKGTENGSLMGIENSAAETLKESKEIANAAGSAELIRRSDTRRNFLPLNGAEPDISSVEPNETHSELHARIAAGLGRILVEMQKLYSDYSRHTVMEEGMKTRSREAEVLAKIQEILDLGPAKQNTERTGSEYSQSSVSADLDHSRRLQRASHDEGRDQEKELRDLIISRAEYLPYASKVDSGTTEPDSPASSPSSGSFHDYHKGTRLNCHGNCLLKQRREKEESDDAMHMEARVLDGKLNETKGISTTTTVLAGVAVISAIGLLIAGFAHTYTTQFTISPAPLCSSRGASLV